MRLERIDGVVLAEEDNEVFDRIDKKYSGACTVIGTQQGIRVSTQQWVGVIRSPNILIHIEPKLPEGNLDLLRLVAYVHGFDGLDILTQTEIMQEGSDSLLELVMLMFIRATQHVVRRGIVRDYVKSEGELTVLRGRMDVPRQYRRRFGIPDKLYCIYDEFTAVIPDNQLLYAALDLCRRLGAPRVVQAAHNRLLAVFSEIADGTPPDPAIADEEIIYSRMNSHYQAAHQYARLLLRGVGIRDMYQRGTLRSYAFLIDMNKLFQGFIERFLRDLFTGSAVEIRTQDHREMNIVWEADEHKNKSIRPDIVLRDRTERRHQLVADAKYKRYDEKDITSGDIYQLFLYSYAYDRESRRACLFYPSETGSFSYRSLLVRGASGQTGARIWLIGVPVAAVVGKAKSEMGKAMINEFRMRLMTILLQPIAEGREYLVSESC